MRAHALGLLAFGALLGGPLAGAATAAGDLSPNLWTWQPYDISRAQGSAGPELRFANAVVNSGNGPLEIYSAKADDCDSDANTANRYAYQRIFQDANNNGTFERNIDTGSRSQLAGCMVYHPEHHHWHFNRFASYRLKALVGGSVVSASEKVTFCVTDTIRTQPSLIGSPLNAFYSRCTRTATQGISIGWVDEYGASLPGQSLPLTGVASGSYCLLSTADPANSLVETSNADNATGVVVNLTSQSASATGQSCT